MNKYILEKNVIIPVTKITKDIESKAVLYKGYMHNGEEIDIYDLENGKLAPIVRYLIEGGDIKGSKLMLWLIIAGSIGLIIVLIIAFSGGSTSTNTGKLEVTKSINPLTKTTTNIKNIDPVKNTPSNNKIKELTGLKNEAENETLKKINEISKLNITIDNLTNKNNNLIQNISELKQQIQKLKNTPNRILNSPGDEFIYYLGDNIFKKCESSLNPKIIDNCKNLYFKYQINAKKQ